MALLLACLYECTEQDIALPSALAAAALDGQNVHGELSGLTGLVMDVCALLHL